MANSNQIPILHSNGKLIYLPEEIKNEVVESVPALKGAFFKKKEIWNIAISPNILKTLKENDKFRVIDLLDVE